MNWIKTFGLMGILTGILLGIGYLLGGMNGAFVTLIFSFILNFISYWYSDKIVLAMYRAREISAADNPMLHQIVNELSDEAKIPKPKIYMINLPIPNAFATGRNPKYSAVAVTRSLLESLEPKEIKGVLAHEISHIKHRDTLIQTIAATFGGAITWLSYGFLFDRDREGFGALLMFILTPLAATLVRMAISRSREYLADESGARITKDPLSLASALEKISKISRVRPININPSTSHLFIVNPFSSASLSSLFSTHPPVEERIKRLKEMAKKMKITH
ncbi:MAG: zinc metalloprotease HtpX [Candidatus Aenigmarchaeota archaeon]|nr:zinc metalloprotease HtpX [Candidatus Aenigmarchaeota archaeon]